MITPQGLNSRQWTQLFDLIGVANTKQKKLLVAHLLTEFENDRENIL